MMPARRTIVVSVLLAVFPTYPAICANPSLDAAIIHANFDAIEPLALRALKAARRGRPELVPTYSGGRGYINGQFGDSGRTNDFQVIWPIRRPSKP